MNSATNYMVEGHGAGILVHEGSDRRGFHFSREQAWKCVKELKESGLYHTIKVRCGGALVWTAYRHDGWTGRLAA